MALENGKKEELGWRKLLPKAKVGRLMVGLVRLVAVLATVAATLVMGLNKQTESTPVAIVGTTTIFQTRTAKFQHTPAFVYFVIANAIASVYNISVLLFRTFVKCKAFDLLVHITDMVMLVLVATGAAAAVFMAELGKNGNLHALWSPICGKFDAFCHRGGWALIASFVGVVLLMILNALSTIGLYRNVAIQS